MSETVIVFLILLGLTQSKATMERNNLSNSLKDQIIGTKAIKYCNNNNNDNNKNMPKDSLNSDIQSYGDDYVNGFSWPPKSYICSFCKREFRSAQALGGHMNVHRKDRARLRQSSPPRDGQYPMLNLNFESNPNPKFSSSSSSLSSTSTRLTPFASTLPSLISPSLSPFTTPSSASAAGEVKKWGLVGNLFDSLSHKSLDLTYMKNEKSLNRFKQEDKCKILKKSKIIRLDLEIGVLGDSKEDLDLELRLGYSN